MGAGGEMALLDGAAVDQEIQVIGRNAAVGQKGGSLGRGSVPADRLAAGLELTQNGQQRVLEALNTSTEVTVELLTGHAPFSLLREQRARGVRLGRVRLGVTGKNAQRPTVNGDSLNVEDVQTVTGE